MVMMLLIILNGVFTRAQKHVGNVLLENTLLKTVQELVPIAQQVNIKIRRGSNLVLIVLLENSLTKMVQ